MCIQLNRATQKVSNLTVEIARVDLQVESLQEIVQQKQEEALALENEIVLLQSKLQGIQEINALVKRDLEKRLATLTELRKKEDSSSGEKSRQTAK